MAFLERHLDELARLKLNVFHWHLTDDQGWRVGANGEPYGGFHTWTPSMA